MTLSDGLFLEKLGVIRFCLYSAGHHSKVLTILGNNASKRKQYQSNLTEITVSELLAVRTGRNKMIEKELIAFVLAFCISKHLPHHCCRCPLASRHLDGRLDEVCWQNAPVYTDFTIMDMDKKATRRTELRIVYTDVAILFAFKAYVPASALPSENEAKKNHVYLSDCVEVMLDPTGGQEYYFHFIVNCYNMRYQRYCEQGGYIGNPHWLADWESAVQQNKDFWCAEIEVPYYSLELNKTIPAWKINAVPQRFTTCTAVKQIWHRRNGATNIAGKFCAWHARLCLMIICHKSLLSTEKLSTADSSPQAVPQSKTWMKPGKISNWN